MENLKNNKIFWVFIVLTIFNVFLLGKIFVDKTVDRVIHKLQKEYSPSPYGPGLDPDKVNPDTFKSTPDAFKSSVDYFNMGRLEEKNKVVHKGQHSIHKIIQDADDWREKWEKSRFSSPLQ